VNIAIRPLAEHDLPEAERIFRLAFGTFLTLPDPMSFMGDADLVKTRWRAAPAAALGAYVDDALAGSNFIANWGSFGFFGPLTVRPDLWDRGVAQKLLAATMDIFTAWGTRHAALFTFSHSAKHVALYQKFGFWPQSLTPVMSKTVARAAHAVRASTYASVPPHAREDAFAECRALTDGVYAGLDLTPEIRAVAQQDLGDTVMIHEGAKLAAFAVCHIGLGSEAGTGAAYIKFAAVRPGGGAAKYFGELLSACEALAAERGAAQLMAGVNTARHDAYRMMLERGYRTFLQGVAMQRPNEPGYNRPDCFVIDDWR
jgi:GNAT superfamily N-acetyltransferase